MENELNPPTDDKAGESTVDKSANSQAPGANGGERKEEEENPTYPDPAKKTPQEMNNNPLERLEEDDPQGVPDGQLDNNVLDSMGAPDTNKAAPPTVNTDAPKTPDAEQPDKTIVEQMKADKAP